jgi:hypothetical protein
MSLEVEHYLACHSCFKIFVRLKLQHLCYLSIAVSPLSFLIQIEIILVLGIIQDFQLDHRHFLVSYYATLDLIYIFYFIF